MAQVSVAFIKLGLGAVHGVPKLPHGRGHLAEARAYSRIAEARQFLIDNGVPAERIRTTRAVVGGARDSQVDFVIAY